MTGPARSWPVLLATLLQGTSLDAETSAWAMSQIMGGEASAAQIAGFAVALKAKGESPEEVRGLAAAMLASAAVIDVPSPVLDTVGTGGDGAHTVNISTMSAVVARAAGARVVKHGNRAASSACGSADVLESLGVPVDLSPGAVERCVAEVGIGFCFAPIFHPALRHAAGPRRELGVPTVFNFLGPLTNPAHPAAQAVGVADARMTSVTADVLARRGTDALVFRGDDGLDELTTTTTSRVYVVRAGTVTETVLDPAELGIAPARLSDLRGGDPARNAAVARAVFAGERGPVRDAVLLNAAAALAAGELSAAPLVEQLQLCLPRAVEAIDSGGAAETLDRWAAAASAARG